MNLKELKAAAEAATPGPWETDDPWVVMSRFKGKVVYVASTDELDTDEDQCYADATFIALANPATILKLIDENADLRAKLSFKEVADHPNALLDVNAICNERDELRQICRTIYDVWAGSEGIPEPETACEAYLLQLVVQMKDEAKRGFK